MYKMKSETQNDLQNAMKFCGAQTPVFSKKRDSRRTGRGNPLLSRRRFLTLQEIDSRLEKITEAE